MIQQREGKAEAQRERRVLRVCSGYIIGIQEKMNERASKHNKLSDRIKQEDSEDAVENEALPSNALRAVVFSIMLQLIIQREMTTTVPMSMSMSLAVAVAVVMRRSWERSGIRFECLDCSGE